MSEWIRQRLKAGHKATPEDWVAELEAVLPNRPTPHEPLRLLSLAVHQDWHALRPVQLQRLARCLAREEQGRFELYDSMEPLPVPLLLVLQRYREVLLASRRLAVAPARWLLAQPPPRTSEVDRDYLLNRIAGQDLLAKLIAMRVLDRHGDASDLPEYLRLAEDLSEPMLVRVGAAARAVRQQGDAAVEPFLEAFLGISAGGWAVGVPSEFYAQRLAAAGPVLIPALVARLGAPTFVIRRRAALTLAALGEPAVPALMEVVREAPAGQGVSNAEMALRNIDPRKVHEARRQRKVDERSLSRAEPPGADAERGLSRPEQ